MRSQMMTLLRTKRTLIPDEQPHVGAWPRTGIAALVCTNEEGHDIDPTQQIAAAAYSGEESHLCRPFDHY
ncbi:hypothetical protein BHE74_00050309, partial [Ensete ventricosum]